MSSLTDFVRAYPSASKPTHVCDLFGVLFERDCNDCDVRERAAKLCSTYPTDLDGSLSELYSVQALCAE